MAPKTLDQVVSLAEAHGERRQLAHSVGYLLFELPAFEERYLFLLFRPLDLKLTLYSLHRVFCLVIQNFASDGHRTFIVMKRARDIPDILAYLRNPLMNIRLQPPMRTLFGHRESGIHIFQCFFPLSRGVMDFGDRPQQHGGKIDRSYRVGDLQGSGAVPHRRAEISLFQICFPDDDQRAALAISRPQCPVDVEGTTQMVERLIIVTALCP